MWTPPALDQLQELSDYVSQDSEAYAAAVITEILDAVDRLECFPRLGRRVPKWDRDELREILVFKWRVAYRILPDRIEIIEIIHGAQRANG